MLWYPCSAQGPLGTRVIWLILVFSAPVTNRWSSGLRHLRFRRSSRLRFFRRNPKNRHSPTSSGIRTLEPQVVNLVCLIDYLRSISFVKSSQFEFRVHLPHLDYIYSLYNSHLLYKSTNFSKARLSYVSTLTEISWEKYFARTRIWTHDLLTHIFFPKQFTKCYKFVRLSSAVQLAS